MSMPNTKDTNPKDAIGTRKLAFSVIPWRALAGALLAMLEGSLKYGRHNYRPAGVRASVYFDACFRHLTSWWEGEDLDPGCKRRIHHIDKAIASLLVLRDSMLHGNWVDDRPPRVDSGWIDVANQTAKDMIDECDAPIDPHTQIPLRYIVPRLNEDMPPEENIVRMPAKDWLDYQLKATPGPD